MIIENLFELTVIILISAGVGMAVLIATGSVGLAHFLKGAVVGWLIGAVIIVFLEYLRTGFFL